jgi:hypothetical protein
MLRAECQFPVVLSGAIAGDSGQLFSKTFKPGDKVELKQDFQAPQSAKEFQLWLKMAPDASNNYSATLTIGQFRLDQLSTTPAAIARADPTGRQASYRQ